MDMKTLKPLIEKYASVYGLKPEIVYGVVKQESSFRPRARRFEKHYRWLYQPERVRPEGCRPETEIALQKTSLGLMQVMGAVYREMGYRGPLSAIFDDPELQLDYGCRFLSGKIKRYGELRGISAYNAGTPTLANMKYVNRVMTHSREWKHIQ